MKFVVGPQDRHLPNTTLPPGVKHTLCMLCSEDPRGCE